MTNDPGMPVVVATMPSENSRAIESTLDAIGTSIKSLQGELHALREVRDERSGGMRKSVELWQALLGIIAMFVAVITPIYSFTQSTHDRITRGELERAQMKTTIDQMLLRTAERDASDIVIRETLASLKADTSWLKMRLSK